MKFCDILSETSGNISLKYIERVQNISVDLFLIYLNPLFEIKWIIWFNKYNSYNNVIICSVIK